MRSITKTLTAVGVSTSIPMDTYMAPFQASIAIVNNGSTVAECTIQYTLDNVFDSSVTPYWWDLTTEASDLQDEGYLLQETGSKILQETGDGILLNSENIVTQVIDFPVSAIRANVTSISAGGSVNFTVLQAGMPGQ